MARLYRKPGTPRWLGFACLVSLFPAITTAGSPETAQNDRALFERLKTVASAEPSAQRQLALITLGGQNLYRAIAQSESDLELAYLATVLLTDQDDLKRQAVSRRALIRLAAVNYVTDESFLLARVMGRDEPSPAVRRAIIAQLRNPPRLVEAAQCAYYQDVRMAATRRVVEPTLAAKVRAATAALRAQVSQIEHLREPRELLPYLRGAQYDVLAIAAAKSLQDQDALAAAAMLPLDYPVLSTVLGKLKDPALLQRVAAEASDPAMRLAAEAKRDRNVLIGTIDRGRASMTFVDRLAGLSADGTEQERTRKEQWFATMVRVLALLRQDLGVARDRMSFVCIPMLLNDDRVPELVDLIEALPDGDTAYLYLHSGQPDLEDAAYDFYRQYRYFDTAKMDGPLPRKRR